MVHRRLLLVESPLGEESKENRSVNGDEDFAVDANHDRLNVNPQFRHYEETSNLQLFFDLFFVANLTSFTEQHEVNSFAKLSSYVGFFCILWFTWCQVTLYDVRFATDSIFERLAHCCHFGVMVGLAVVGPQFDPNDPDVITWDTLQQLSLILMVSRLVLLAQYGSTLCFTWRYRSTRKPMLLIMVSLAIAASVYMALSFAFMKEVGYHAYVAWYAVAVTEVAANIAISGWWRILSFKNTHLTERMTCLTLIILGEGVIGITKSIVKIEGLDYNFSPGAIGTIISGVIIIYLVYQLYFDNVQTEHFGTIRQQIWAFLHFPLHAFLVMLMEGNNQFISLFHIIEYFNMAFAELNAIYDNPNATLNDYYLAFNQTINNVTDTFEISQDKWDSLQADLAVFSPGSNATGEELNDSTSSIAVELFKTIFDGYGFEPPETDADLSFADQIDAYYAVFELVFGYFFICAGMVLIIIAVLSWLSLPHTTSAEYSGISHTASHSRLPHRTKKFALIHRPYSRYIGILANFLLGIGLALLAIMVLTDAADILGESPWTLPVLVFVLLIALVLNHVGRWFGGSGDEEQTLEMRGMGMERDVETVEVNGTSKKVT